MCFLGLGVDYIMTTALHCMITAKLRINELYVLFVMVSDSDGAHINTCLLVHNISDVINELHILCSTQIESHRAVHRSQCMRSDHLICIAQQAASVA